MVGEAEKSYIVQRNEKNDIDNWMDEMKCDNWYGITT